MIKYKRIMAYIIDIILISMVVSLICNSSFLKKYTEKYTENSTAVTELYSDLSDKTVDEVSDKIHTYAYDQSKYGIIYNVVEIVLYIGYFVFFQFYNKGQTIGKKLLKIKLESSNNNKLSLPRLLLRSLILYGTIITIINMISVSLLNVDNFYNVYLFTGSLDSLISLATILMILFRKDERGIHDIISNTKVTNA